MSRFTRHWSTISVAMGGFSVGAVVSVLLTRDSKAKPADNKTLGDQLFQGKWQPPLRPVQASASQVQRIESSKSDNFDSAINTCRKLVRQTKESIGIPGLCVAVSVDGRTVWTEGFGFSDVENGVLCSPKTVMRIASISKSLTMTALAKLWEEGKIDLDQPVQYYVPNFPQKSFDGETVEITTRMLVSHLSGIRHWKGGEEREPSTDKGAAPEFYLNTNFKTVEEALSIFQNDELLHKPGTKYLYSSPAWTLVSVVMEKAAGKSYPKVMMDLFHLLGLKNTSLDENDPIIMNRSRYYTRDKNGRLVNSPSVNNSVKWAGGGLQSTVGDLVKFGNAVLYSYQGGDGCLKKDTIDAIWTIAPNTVSVHSKQCVTSGYGMGWFLNPALDKCGGVEPQALAVYHTGGAVGASSILYITPHSPQEKQIPSGVTVAIIVNLQGVGLQRLAEEITSNFASVKQTSS